MKKHLYIFIFVILFCTQISIYIYLLLHNINDISYPKNDSKEGFSDKRDLTQKYPKIIIYNPMNIVIEKKGDNFQCPVISIKPYNYVNSDGKVCSTISPTTHCCIEGVSPNCIKCELESNCCSEYTTCVSCCIKFYKVINIII